MAQLDGLTLLDEMEGLLEAPLRQPLGVPFLAAVERPGPGASPSVHGRGHARSERLHEIGAFRSYAPVIAMAELVRFAEQMEPLRVEPLRAPGGETDLLQFAEVLRVRGRVECPDQRPSEELYLRKTASE